MTYSQRLKSKLQLVGTLALASVLWISTTLAQCVYADSVDLVTAHYDSSNCVLHDNNPVKKDKDCVDCNNIRITLTTQENAFSEKNHYEKDKQPTFAALATLDEHSYKVDSACNAGATTRLKYNYSPPIYLQNCAFLN